MDKDECQKIEKTIMDLCINLYLAADKNLFHVIDFLLRGIVCMLFSSNVSEEDFEEITKSMSEDYKKYIKTLKEEK